VSGLTLHSGATVLDFHQIPSPVDYISILTVWSRVHDGLGQPPL